MKKFLITFVLSFIAFYLLEHLVSYVFDIDVDNLEVGWLGWLGVVIFYGFKFHILCCLLPFLFSAYKCRHKKCEHEHCTK